MRTCGPRPTGCGHATQRKMYVTGSVGSEADARGLRAGLRLAQQRLYRVLCRLRHGQLSAHRMFRLTGNADAADELERVDVQRRASRSRLGRQIVVLPEPVERSQPPAKQQLDVLPAKPVADRDAGRQICICRIGRRRVYVNLFIAGRCAVALPKTPVSLEVETNYPWNGAVTDHRSSPSARPSLPCACGFRGGVAGPGCISTGRKSST